MLQAKIATRAGCARNATIPFDDSALRTFGSTPSTKLKAPRSAILAFLPPRDERTHRNHIEIWRFQMSLRTRNIRLAALTVAVSAAVASTSAFAGDLVNLGALSSSGPVDGFIVTYKDGSASKNNKAAIQRSLDSISASGFGRAKAMTLRHDRTLGVGADLVVANRSFDRVDAEQLMRQLAANPDVASVEPNIRLYPTLTPNDTFFNLQYGFQSGIGGSNADQAWNLGFLGAGKIVAVIDTGYRPHVDLNANIINGYDFITNVATANDGNGRDSSALDPGDWSPTPNLCYPGSPVTNSSWHGTHVAGTVAAVTNNAAGVAGMAYKSKVLAVRALGRCGGTLADIADAVTWASGGTVPGVPAVGANKATVINMSLGGGGSCAGSVMQTAITGALGRRTTVVVAAGNSNANVSGFTPASCTGAGLIVVGATDSAAKKASFSNFGAGVDVSAPGVSIASTLNAGTTVPGADNYVYYSGTSMASPHVAGLVALMQSKPAADCAPAQVETLIKTWIKPFAAPPPPVGTMGTGIINAFTTVQNAPC
ncbi:MAG: peptidase S8 [Lysobacter sp.]|nr:MAG: peptidase S8 [Lysobacter sp.]